MASLAEFLSMPMFGGPNARPVGLDELGNVAYRPVMGPDYRVVKQAPNRGSVVKGFLSQLMDAPGATLGGLAKGAAQGTWDAIRVPGRSWSDTVTYGDVANTAGLVSLPAVAGKYDPAVANMGVKAYHRSNADFDAFEPSKTRGASFFAATPESAIKGSSAGQNELARHFARSDEKKRLFDYEVDIDDARIEGLAYTPEEVAWFDSMPNEIVGDDALTKAFEGAPPNIRFDDHIYDATKIGDRLYKYTKKGAPPVKSYAEAVSSGRDVYGRQIAHWGPGSDELATANRVRSRGMGGYLVNDEAGVSLAVTDPSIVNILKKTDVTPRPRIRAYHGSPHDFDRFDMSKIGTGEGAQAYGHGLYFAEAEDVARHYRDNLSGGRMMNAGVSFDGGDVFDAPDGTRAILQELDPILRKTGSVDAALKELDDRAANARLGYTQIRSKDMADFLRQNRDRIEYTPPGRMYEVDINADPADFLDLSAPFSDWPQSHVDALKGSLGDYMNDVAEWFPEFMEGGELSDVLNNFDDISATEMNRSLQDRGISGIKYWDGASRGRPGATGTDGTRNYVVFDDSLIEILRKYGLAGAMLGAGVYPQEEGGI